jgi:hypothetical protein
MMLPNSLISDIFRQLNLSKGNCSVVPMSPVYLCFKPSYFCFNLCVDLCSDVNGIRMGVKMCEYCHPCYVSKVCSLQMEKTPTVETQWKIYFILVSETYETHILTFRRGQVFSNAPPKSHLSQPHTFPSTRNDLGTIFSEGHLSNEKILKTLGIFFQNPPHT